MSTPPPGWYDDPGGAGQRYWDGTGWTGRLRGWGELAEGGDDHPFASAAAAGVVAYLALLVLVNPHLGGTAAFGAGRLLVPPVLAVLAIGLVAREHERWWGWWVYAVTVPALTALLTIMLNLDELVLTGPDPSAGGGIL